MDNYCSIAIVCFAILILSVAVDAQAETESTFKETFSFRTLADDFISPVKTKARYSFLGGSALTAAVMLRDSDQSIDRELYRDHPLGSYSRFGDIAGQLVPNVAYAASMFALRYFDDEPKFAKRAHHMVRATMHAAFLSTILKISVREARPDNVNNYASFPSGHAATAFAFASVVATEHEWYWGVASYALATFVGVSRINDHRHRMDDVLAGATIGISYGLGVYYNMQQSSDQASVTGSKPDSSIALLPLDGFKGGVFAFKTQF